jgi:protein-S-isoprenylcysteine O-methyltransferase Ste14
MSLIPAFEIGIWNGWLFMCVFILQMLAVMLLGKGAWDKSSHPTDVKKSRLERLSPFMGNGVWILATLYSIFLPFKLGTPWFYTGLAVFLVGLIILAVATADFATAPPRKPSTRGVYSLSRHPMYLSMIIIYLGTAIAGASWVFLLLGAASAFWVAIEARVEERYCLKHYGDAYRDYMKRTPRWLGLPKSV